MIPRFFGRRSGKSHLSNSEKTRTIAKDPVVWDRIYTCLRFVSHGPNTTLDTK